MKEKPPAFQWYPKDFLSDEKVIFMSMAQRGVYITLLSMCWIEKSLPNDLGVIALKLGAELADVEEVCKKCFDVKGNRLINRRLERERRSQKANKRTRSRAGIKGAKVRWQTHGKRMANASDENGNAIDLPLAKNSSSSATASATASQKREKDSLSGVDGIFAKSDESWQPPGDSTDSNESGQPPQEPIFADWYATYPRKIAKSDAQKAWDRLSKVKRQRILATWAQWRTEFESRASDYVPYPASFIRESAWEEPPPPTTSEHVRLRSAKDASRPLPIHEKCGKPQGTCECFDEDQNVSPEAKSDKWKERTKAVTA